MPRRRRIIDPDESEGDVEIEEEEEVEEEETPTRASDRQVRNTRNARGSRQRNRAEVREDGEPCSSRRLERSQEELEDEGEHPSIIEPMKQKCPTVGEAVLAALALSSKGSIKEPELKPLLYRGRFKDWQDGLNDLNSAFANAFGITVVYDGPSHNFFVRNDFASVRAELNELYSEGALEGIRIAPSAGAKESTPADALVEDEFNDDDKKGLLFTLLSSIMMSNNVELGHKQWFVDEDILKDMCKKMKVPDEVLKKTVSGYNAEFIRAGWLRKIEEKDTNKEIMPRYTWGQRAISTISVLEVFIKFCYVNKQSPQEWGNYHEILRKLDEKNGLNNPP
uniref:MAGE domain-containing protein n=1 Tax=Panagrolaimus sp. PS1159 TaxID=55785 RepID=A0AC35GXU5_9BILA